MTKISTHALREEGDTTQIRAIRPSSVFLPTPSARRATDVPDPEHHPLGHFYPRPPRGGRLGNCKCSFCFYHISTHALREEGDVQQAIDNSVIA